MTNYKNWLDSARAEKCIENLKKNGFEAVFCNSSEDAEKLVINMVRNENIIGIGGSDTIRSLRLNKTLAKMGKTILDHNDEAISKEDSVRIRKEQVNSDCFLCSANALTMTGEIVNIDGVGNRVNAMTFGPDRVIIVAGINKITNDVHSGIRRIKDTAAPMRAKSLNMATPCAKTGICSDCNSPMRICRITSIIHKKPMLTDIAIIIVNESLGY